MRRIALLLAIPFALSGQTPEQLFQERRYDEARIAFQSQLAKDKNDANALYYMGRIAEVQGRSGEAVDWYEKAVKQNDKSALYRPWLHGWQHREGERAGGGNRQTESDARTSGERPYRRQTEGSGGSRA